MQPPRYAGEHGVSEENYLRIHRLSKDFDGVAAVDDVTVDIRKGEIFALLGSSGCGKSTLLRMLAGFETPGSGSIALDGIEISKMPPYERPINMMFQSYALFPHMTVWENIAFGLKRQKRDKRKIADQVEQMLALVQLKPYAKRKPHQLSGGQQQRVALARSLALEPRLLLLDEPLGALDRKLREQTQFELKNIIKKVGVTCVMVTHDQEEAMTMADRIAIMSSGSFKQVGTPQDIYETPNCRFVADFIGNVNLFQGTLAEDEPDHCVVDTAHGKLYVGHGISGSLGMALSVALRPENIELRREPPANRSHNCVQGKIKESAYFGASSSYRVLLDSGLQLQVTIPSTERHSDMLERGASVYAVWRDTSLMVLTQ